ncbi:MAG: putative 2-aminoethylphosphonate ABC transporter ATP-binding protein [Granulosicoccus sp.]|nr:putative 2-aminoethylphosphonate ABC transporter ATP-binding protein [Granulosicoccus sp.]
MLRTDDENPAFLKINALWKAFGDFLALKDISLEVAEGEFVCFLGPSGCGKTTLLRAIAGLDPQTRGTIEQSSRDISNLPPAQRDYGIVFQSYALFPNLSIRRNVAYGLENAGHSRSKIDARVDELLQLVDLPEQGNKYPAQLSGGQQQRIALARAIATKPGLLLLDEPLSALDARVRVSLRHQIKELQRKLGVTTVMVTHDQEEGLSMADRIVVMNHGRIEQVGTPIQIYRDPDTLFVADFIGEMNQVQGVAETADRVRIGEVSFNCQSHGFSPDEKVLATVRPEDIVPIERDHSDQADPADQGVEVHIGDMEFLGSYWKARLDSPRLSGSLNANLSMNAVRRMELSVGSHLQVRLPSDRLKLFANPSAVT